MRCDEARNPENPQPQDKSRTNLTARTKADEIFAHIFCKTRPCLPGYPSIKPKGYRGVMFYPDELESLRSREWLGDAMMNASIIISITKTVRDETNFLSDTYFTRKLLAGSILDPTYIKFIRTTDFWRCKIWLMPFLLVNHWVLLVVVPDLHCSFISIPAVNRLRCN